MNNPLTPPAIEISVTETDQTIISLQNIIERNANALKEVKKNKKLVADQQKSIVENDPIIAELTEQMQPLMQEIAERKAKIKSNVEFVKLNVQKKELGEEEKEISETLSSHLTNYYTMTGTKSIPNSQGSEVGFKIKSNFTSKQLELF